MVVPDCNSNGRISTGQTWLPSEFEASLGYMRSFLKQSTYLKSICLAQKRSTSLHAHIEVGQCLELMESPFDRERTAAENSEPSNPEDPKLKWNLKPKKPRASWTLPVTPPQARLQSLWLKTARPLGCGCIFPRANFRPQRTRIEARESQRGKKAAVIRETGERREGSGKDRKVRTNELRRSSKQGPSSKLEAGLQCESQGRSHANAQEEQNPEMGVCSPAPGHTDHGDLTASFLVWALGSLVAFSPKPFFPSPLYSLSQAAALHSHRVAWLRQGEQRFSPVLGVP